jgi:hypothetical protein
MIHYSLVCHATMVIAKQTTLINIWVQLTTSQKEGNVSYALLLANSIVLLLKSFFARGFGYQVKPALCIGFSIPLTII